MRIYFPRFGVRKSKMSSVICEKEMEITPCLLGNVKCACNSDGE